MNEASAAPVPDDTQATLTLGRRHALLVVGGLIGLNLATSALVALSSGLENPLANLGRFLITVLLCLALYRGANWARRVLLLLIGLALAVYVASALPALGNAGLLGMVLLVGFIAGYLGLGYLLWRSAALKQFMAAQRGRGHSPTAGAAT